MRNGDFSELLAAGVQIYNPFSAQSVGGITVATLGSVLSHLS